MRLFRAHLIDNFSRRLFVNLHGDSNIQEKTPDGDRDENVFEIKQGVSISLLIKAPKEGRIDSSYSYVNFWGTQEEKLDRLLYTEISSIRDNFKSKEPTYLFNSISESKDVLYESATPLANVLPVVCGIETKRDHFALGFDREELRARIGRFINFEGNTEELKAAFDVQDNDWSVASAKALLKGDPNWERYIQECSVRPFDNRAVFYCDFVLARTRGAAMKAMSFDNLGLVVSRQTKEEFGVFVSDKIITHKYVTAYDRSFLMPMHGETSESASENLRHSLVKLSAMNIFSDRTGLEFEDGIRRDLKQGIPASVQGGKAEKGAERTGRGDLVRTFGPRDFFDWVYAVLHSPVYRTRYAEFLKSDFPRIVTPNDRDIFAALVPLGRALTALHLLKSDEATILQNPEIRFVGRGEARVARGYPRYENGKILINDSRWFEDVPRETWEFHVGGYQVCDKWLKDRAAKGGKNPSPGRVLTDGDILHYRRVVTALTETRRIMAEIDRIIDAHGGWPNAFYMPPPPPPPPTVEEIIQADESRELEFKSTFQWDVRERKQNRDLQKSVLKTLVAFMNSEGGTLVIGVTDEKEIHGLDDDLGLTKSSLDVFEQTLLNVFSSTIGVAYAQHIAMRFADAPGGKKVCVIDVKASQEPTFLEFQGKHEFFIRRGNASVSLNPSEQHAYTRQRFGHA